MSPPADRPAGADRRNHGNLQLRPNGDGARHDGDVRDHVSRGGTTPETRRRRRLTDSVVLSGSFGFSGPRFVPSKVSQEPRLPGRPGQTGRLGDRHQGGLTEAGHGGGGSVLFVSHNGHARSALRFFLYEFFFFQAPESYKNVTDVVNTCHDAGISKKAIKLRPIAVIKG